jgi:hypothetical protein
MPIFRRRRDKEPPPIPEWASFFDREEYRTFLGLVDIALERQGHEEREWGDGVVQVLLDGEPHTLGLANLAQMVRGEPREDWEAIVGEHFRRLGEVRRDSDDVPFEAAEPILKLRLWRREDLPEELDHVSRPFADDLVLMLSLDWPEAVTNVTSEQVAAWGRGEEKLFAIAERNTREEPDIEQDELVNGEGARAVVCFGDSFFASSQVLWPERYLGDLPPDGALVAVPHRHMAWMYALTDVRALRVINEAAGWVHQVHVEGPGSISSQLYWFRPGRDVVRLPVEVSDATIRFSPPEEFVETLNGLAEPPAR